MPTLGADKQRRTIRSGIRVGVLLACLGCLAQVPPVLADGEVEATNGQFAGVEETRGSGQESSGSAKAFDKAPADGSVSSVSMVKLLSNGHALDGAKVVVSGYTCREQVSESALFLSSEDCRNGNFHNAIKLSGRKSAADGFAGLVIVRGTFRDWSTVIWTDENVTAGEIEVQSVLEMRKQRR